LKEVLEQIKSAEIVKLLSELVAKDTVNPPGNEYRAARIVEREFKKSKIKYKKFEKTKGRTNIIGYIGKGKPSLFFAAHSDTVPVDVGWKTDPFKLVKKGSRLYGLGTSDNKGPLACLIVLAKVLKKHEKKLKGQVLISAVADEETGSKEGIHYLIDNKIKPDYAIIPDVSSSMKNIDIGEKGRLVLRISSYGKQAHGSRPYEGVNAIYKMMDLLKVLKNFKLRYRKHKLFTPPTINIGMISGGSALNSVPSLCHITLDIRYLPKQIPRKIINELKTLIKKVDGKYKIEVLDGGSVPTEISPDNVLVRSIKSNTKKVLNKAPVPDGISGGTVVKQLLLHNILAVAFGPGNEIHCPNEYIEEKELTQFTKICTLVSFDLLGKNVSFLNESKR